MSKAVKPCRSAPIVQSDPEKFSENGWGALLQLAARYLRSKGILAIDGARAAHVYQGVTGGWTATGGSPWKERREASSQLVFIGRNLDGENLSAASNDCTK